MKEDTKEKSDFGEAAAAKTVFNLPNYILKNLTPVRAIKKGNSHNSVKQLTVEERKKRLQERSKMVKQKVEFARMREKTASQTLAKNLQSCLELAETRRAEFLHKKRQRAKYCSSSFLRSHFKLSDASNNIDHCPQPFNNANQINCAPRIQELVQSSLKLRETRFLETFESIAPRKILSYIDNGSDVQLLLLDIITLLSLPDILPGDRYKCFLWIFYFTNDFRSAPKNFLYSSYNTNTGRRDYDRAVNVISILLYKSGCELIKSLRNLINDIGKPNDMSSLIEDFKKDWIIYHFLFIIFRKLHILNCLTIIKHALFISDQHNAIMKFQDPEINKLNQLIKLQEKVLEKNSKDVMVNGSWTYFGIESAVLWADINKTTKKHHESKPLDIEGSILSSKVIIKDLIVQSETQVRSKRMIFKIPPLIRPLEWRKFWANIYFSSSDNEDYVPKRLATGLFLLKLEVKGSTRSHNFDSLNLDHIYKKYDDLAALYSRKDQIECLNNISNDVFELLFNFCENFDNLKLSNEAESIKENFTNVRKSFESEFLTLNGQFLQYFKLKLYCFKHLLILSDISALSKFSQEVSDIISGLNNYSNYQYRAIDLLSEFLKCLEISVLLYWCDKCAFANRKDIKVFENTCQLVSVDHFSIERGLNFPQLRFPIFYNNIILKNYTFRDNINNYKCITNACLEYPDIFSSEISDKAITYFSNLLSNTMILSSTKKPYVKSYENVAQTEFTRLFSSQIVGLLRRIKSLLYANATTLILLNYLKNREIGRTNLIYDKIPLLFGMLRNYYLNAPNTCYGSIVDIISNFIEESVTTQVDFLDLEFSSYLKNELRPDSDTEVSTIIELTGKKLCKLSSECENSNPFFNLLRGNFFFCKSEVREVLMELKHLSKNICDIYSPLLDWIYKDLGTPK